MLWYAPLIPYSAVFFPLLEYMMVCINIYYLDKKYWTTSLNLSLQLFLVPLPKLYKIKHLAMHFTNIWERMSRSKELI